MNGIEDVLARISQIQTQLGIPPTTATTSTGSISNTTGSDFASELAAASGDGPGSDGGTTGVSGSDVVTDAKKYLGVPYVFGGTNPATGLDCSGLTQHVYKDLGIKLPRTAHEQATVGTPVASLDQAKPGDLICFNRPVTHIAIYIGNGMMIAAPKPGDHVKIEKVYGTPSTIRRILPANGSNPLSPVAIRPAALNTGGTSLSSLPYANLFVSAGAKHGVSAKLLAAVAKVESNYNPRAVSPAGAEGLMQIMPATARGMGINPFDPAQAVDGAARILAGNLKQFDSLPLAIAAYNAGGGAVHKYGGIPPFAETQAYVPKVQAALAALG